MTAVALFDAQKEPLKFYLPNEAILLISEIRDGIWLLGIPAWLFGIFDRGTSILADNYVSVPELFQVLFAFAFFLAWLYLKPEQGSKNAVLAADEMTSIPEQHSVYFGMAQQRMDELQNHHLISQEYILPFPYLCQIYHLLNLKHLESVHNFSLNNLKVLQVSDFQPTLIGGVIRFQTVLDSPMNALRIWRQPVVDVDLTLLTPYTVELSIPAYRNKRITVLFTVVPLGENAHKFIVNIYSDLKWPKPLMQCLLHIAACLTLFEDLPYLQTLATRNMQHLLGLGRVANHETMRLFQRFVDLYGGSLKPARSLDRLAVPEASQ